MDTLKMILANGTQISISEVNFPLHIVVERETKDDIHAIWNSFTEEALQRVVFKDKNTVLFTFLNCKVRGEQIVVNADDSITGHYYFDGEREVYGETELETAAKILLGEEE